MRVGLREVAPHHTRRRIDVLGQQSKRCLNGSHALHHDTRLVDAVDRYTISGIGYGLEGTVSHVAGSSSSIDEAILPYLMASDAKLVEGKVVGDPTEGALLVLGAKAGVDIEGSRAAHPRLATLPFDPTTKLMATFHEANLAGVSEVGEAEGPLKDPELVREALAFAAGRPDKPRWVKALDRALATPDVPTEIRDQLMAARTKLEAGG